MCTKIKIIHPGKLIDGIILLHDNACHHVVHRVQNKVNAIQWKVLKQHAHSPDLFPCDFHAFGPSQKALKSHMFTSDDNVQGSVVQWFRQQPKEFFANRTRQLLHQWDSCLNARGDLFNCCKIFTCEHSRTGFV
jgi:hypothetical protein